MRGILLYCVVRCWAVRANPANLACSTWPNHHSSVRQKSGAPTARPNPAFARFKFANGRMSNVRFAANAPSGFTGRRGAFATFLDGEGIPALLGLGALKPLGGGRLKPLGGYGWGRWVYRFRSSLMLQVIMSSVWHRSMWRVSPFGIRGHPVGFAAFAGYRTIAPADGQWWDLLPVFRGQSVGVGADTHTRKLTTRVRTEVEKGTRLLRRSRSRVAVVAVMVERRVATAEQLGNFP